jgi:hypothetical protein
MQIDEIELMWREDSQIDPDNLHNEAIRGAQLHGKYYELQNKIYQLKKVKESEYNSLYTEKTLYYMGKADPEVYKTKPFPHKILKSDVHLYLNSDEDLTKAKSRFDYCTYMMNYVADIIKMIHNRSFQIKDSIDFAKFIAGQ